MIEWNQINNPRSERSAAVIVLFVLLSGIFVSGNSRAGSATWKISPIDNNWNNPLNWSPETVPMSEGDVATFGASSITEITASAGIAVSSVVFEPEAARFTITPAAEGMAIFAPGIVNNSGVVQNFVASADEPGFGPITLADTASAGKNTAFLARATAATNGDKGIVEFRGPASAGAALFINEGGDAERLSGGETLFFGRGTAKGATMISYGGTASGASGGITWFVQGPCHAGNATLIAYGGSNGGSGGEINFSDRSTGDTARVEVFGNGSLSFSFANGDVSIGSLEGDGLVFLGSRTFTIGGNNLSTTFSGLIQDGVAGRGPFSKVGTGVLTLSGANTYSKDTIVTGGTLLVANSSGSATGTGAVQVDAGTLGGNGSVSGAVTVGSGNGPGTFLAPASGGNKPATFTTQSGLTLQADATYTYTFKAKNNKARADLVIADGVTINGATLNLSGQTEGQLKRGLTLTLISNTSANPISGTFSNLPDGAIVNVNGNNLQASYSGGDGNDLTLRVVP